MAASLLGSHVSVRKEGRVTPFPAKLNMYQYAFDDFFLVCFYVIVIGSLKALMKLLSLPTPCTEAPRSLAYGQKKGTEVRDAGSTRGV